MPHPQIKQIALNLSGMTCASCAAKVEQSLNRLESVTASVNYATAKAQITFDSRLASQADLLQAVAKTGYQATPFEEANQADKATTDRSTIDPNQALQLRLLISAVLSLPVVATAMVPELQFAGWQWLSLALTAPVVLWGGWSFHRAAWINLKHRSATMDTLVSVGTLTAFTWSLYALLFGDAGHAGMQMSFDLTPERSSSSSHIYLETAAAVTTLILLGRYLENRAKRQAGSALRALLKLQVQTVTVLGPDGNQSTIPIQRLSVGDHFLVRPGERIPSDARVVDGHSSVDNSMLTGESIPIDIGPESEIIGGTVNLGGQFTAITTATGGQTALSQITRMVEAAQAGKAQIQRLADRVSAIFVPTILLIAAATFVLWLISGSGTAFAFTAASAVLIIACPCALGLATPTALLVGTGRGAQLGILIKGPEVLESTRRIDTVVFDKTGTVTHGSLQVIDLVVADQSKLSSAINLAGSLESRSEHPAAHAIYSYALRHSGAVSVVEEFENHQGLGITGSVLGQSVTVGRELLLKQQGFVFDQCFTEAQATADRNGYTVVFCGWDQRVEIAFLLADTVKPSSAAAIKQLREAGLKTVLLTGDSQAVADLIAKEVGIERVVAGVLPDGKREFIQQLQQAGSTVAMVGDGVNDAPALAQADLGVAIGTGTDIAAEASDITIMSGDLAAVNDAVKLSQNSLKVIKQNLAWAFGYNLAAVPLAAAGLLNPMIAAAAMAFSSVSVVLNALRLRRFKPSSNNPTSSLNVIK